MTIAVMITYDNIHHLENLLVCVTNKQNTIDDSTIKWLNDSIDLLKGKFDFSSQDSDEVEV